jgi:lysozyme
MNMIFSSNGLEILKRLEGFSATAYPDAAGKQTIGYGHLIVKDDDLPSTGSISFEKATELLEQDVQKAIDCVNNCVTSNLTQNQFDALVIFTYNVGTNALQNSTLLDLINAGKLEDASDQLPRWCKVHTKQGAFVEIAGLRNRRLAEQDLFDLA